MDVRNTIISSLYNLFKKELSDRLGIELTMDSSYDNNEVLNAEVITADSSIIDANLKQLKLKIKNIKGTSFSSLDKNLTGKTILINNTEWGKVIEHDYYDFDFTYDSIVVQGDFLSITDISQVNEISVRNSDVIYLYVKTGNLPRLSAFNRIGNKGMLFLLQFQVISKDDKEHKKIEEYTSEFYDIFYRKYKRSFPIYDEKNKILTYSTGSFSDMSTDDMLLKADDAVVRIITIPALVNINYNK